ncbi:MFS transporter [Chitinivorax sp. B]|uniref:MFS transporter n=1 Tax=Chitinivorax sp. B TaxID=2502235 RepID=UPI0010F76198|nr:MFS transporter [Chitinivorax sp. B]
MYAKNRWVVLGIVSSTLFLILIDMTVLYTALPTLVRELGASASEKLWIVNAYPLAVAGLLPSTGLLSDRFGHKKLFMLGLPVFGLTSLLAAYSPTASLLIVSRVLLAIGAAMMMPATLAIVRFVFEDERERALAIGIWAAVASSSAALGPVIGGLLLEYFWWGSVFLVNVPIVLLVLPIAFWQIPHCGGQAKRPLDLIGSVQVMAGLIATIYAIKTLGHQRPDWLVIIISATTGIGLLWLFARRQLRLRAPMIDFTLFRNRRFTAGIVTALTTTLAIVGLELVLSQRLQLVLGLSPLSAALLLLPISIAAMVAGPLTGLAIPTLGERHIMWLGLLLAGLGAAGLAISHQAPLTIQIACLVVFGFTVDSAITAASTAMLLSVREDQAGMAASIEDISYELGGVLGVALLGSIMTLVYSLSFRLPPGLEAPTIVRDSLDEALLIATSLAPEQAAALSQFAKMAFDHAFVAVTFVTSSLLIAAAVMVRSIMPEHACTGYHTAGNTLNTPARKTA